MKNITENKQQSSIKSEVTVVYFAVTTSSTTEGILKKHKSLRKKFWKVNIPEKHFNGKLALIGLVYYRGMMKMMMIDGLGCM